MNERRFNLVPFVGWTSFDSLLTSKYGPMFENDFYFGGRASVRLFSIVWLDFAGGITSAKPCNCNQTWTHYTGNLMLLGTKPRRISPFFSLGGGVSQFSPRITADERDGVVEATGGFRVRIADGMGLRLEARNTLLLPKEDWFTKSHIDNTVLGAGLIYAFGGRPPDGDGDAVPDKRDKCPDTPHGCRVDEKGCPIDSDRDGVCDGIDQCPNTLAGAKVDAKGCPIDSDGDGAYDGLDQCADTPKGAAVDAKGCPVDSDGDGVFDGLDTCPGTPKGCTIDATGCPADADGDGVCDGLDQCANTPVGFRVTATGCPIEITWRERQILDTGRLRQSSSFFAVGKAELGADAPPVLDSLALVLQQYPTLKLEISGHTDNTGTDQKNQALSEARAKGVFDYVAGKNPGLAGNLTWKGYGSSQPVAPNTTAKGKAMNRRVELRVLNPEALQVEREKRRYLLNDEAVPPVQAPTPADTTQH